MSDDIIADMIGARILLVYGLVVLWLFVAGVVLGVLGLMDEARQQAKARATRGSAG